jgi:hypothetical protein
MELLVVFALLLALAVLATRFGADSRGGPDWSLGPVVRSASKLSSAGGSVSKLDRDR